MTLNLGGWVHSFTVTDTQTHKGGYTIYKITSIVFPRSVPQALTCLVVWKRFHDVKRLHRELVRRHKSLQLPGTLPQPTDSSYFKRFDADVIQRRKVYILELLDFVSQHPALYKCNAFAVFFLGDALETSKTTPLHKLYVDKLSNAGKITNTNNDAAHGQSVEGNIAEICDKLDLLYDPHNAGGISPLDPTRDKTNDDDGDDDDVVAADESQAHQQNTDVVSINVDERQSVQLEAVDETVTPIVETKSTKDYTRFLTPMASIESDDSDYIYEAALEFSHAVQAEVNQEYSEAHASYKRGVELLLHGVKDDANDERTFIAKAKITKYLARADEIYIRFLRDGVDTKKPHFQLSLDVDDSADEVATRYLERPWNELAKYKVQQVLGERVMQVQCVTTPQQPACIMKGVEKPSSNSPTQSIFLPQKVPYMVELLAYFQSEQKIFLLLRQAEGGLLYDNIKNYSPTPTIKCTNYAQLFPALNIVEPKQMEEVMTREEELLIMGTAPTNSSDTDEIVRCSQQLLKSVSNTLRECDDQQLQQQQKRQQPKLTPVKSPKRDYREIRIPEVSLRQWACELAIAIHGLHDKGVILSDLHMSNILLGAKGQLLLTYFYQNEGLIADVSYVHKTLSPSALKGHFVAPERPLTFKSDWWSYGVVLYQLLVGLPYRTTHPGQIDLYGTVQYPDNIEISTDAQDLLEKLLQLRADLRLDYEQLQAHAFFSGIDWQSVLQQGLQGK